MRKCEIERLVLEGAEEVTYQFQYEPSLARDFMVAMDILRAIINDLPSNRDWLDPDVEQRARTMLNNYDSKGISKGS